MAVRRKKGALLPAPSEPPPVEEPEEPVQYTKRDLGIREAIRSLRWWGKSTKEIAVRVAEQFEIPESQARRQIYIVRAEENEIINAVLKTGRQDQILTNRRLYGLMETKLKEALAEERQAKKAGKEFRPSRLVPTYAELLKCQDLSADLEGNRAPTKQVRVTADVSQGVLDFLGASSPDEIAELLGEGRKLLEGRPVIDVEGSELG